MEKLDSFYQWLLGQGIFLFDRQLPFSNDCSRAVTVRLPAQEKVGIFIDLGRMESRADELSTLLHEGGHCATGATHALHSPYDLVEKHEYKADKWAVQRAISAEELDGAVAEGHTELWDLAEHFGVTEELMQKAVCWYVHGNLDVERYLSM